MHHNRLHNEVAALLALLAVVFLSTACGQLPPPAAVPPAPTAPATIAPSPAPVTTVALRPIADGPTLLRAGVSLRRIITAPGGSIRIAQSPLDGALYLLSPTEGLYRLSNGTDPDRTLVASARQIVGPAQPAGMAFAPDGTLYVVANRARGATTTAIIRRGAPADGGFTWSTLATTAPYALSGTPFDHLFNGVVVSPDGAFIYVNSGSRTDHGEVEDNRGQHPEVREQPLTSAIFRLPADASDLLLPNDAAALAPYLFADGLRNAYDLAFAPSGELFAIDNGPDADFPDELNQISAGAHYGFPWRFGSQDNPQQTAGYDPTADKRLNSDFTAVNTGTYRNDPSFPPAPAPFTDPLLNYGPAAAQYRADDGSQRDAAADGDALPSFTPHRSPLGLVFSAGPAMPTDLRGADAVLAAFVLSWGAAGGTLSDTGQDLLFLRLERSGDSYRMTATQIARDFANPIDAVLIENRLYILEFGARSALWELTFE